MKKLFLISIMLLLTINVFGQRVRDYKDNIYRQSARVEQPSQLALLTEQEVIEQYFTGNSLVAKGCDNIVISELCSLGGGVCLGAAAVCMQTYGSDSTGGILFGIAGIGLEVASLVEVIIGMDRIRKGNKLMKGIHITSNPDGGIGVALSF